MASREALLEEARRRGLTDGEPEPRPMRSRRSVNREALIAEAKRRGIVGEDFEGGEVGIGSTRPTTPQKTTFMAGLGQFGSGAVESVADTLGLPADLLLQGLRKAGAPIPGSDRMIRDWYAGNGEVLAGMPSDHVGRMARGAGRGVADVATMLAPMGAVAAGAKAGSLSGKVAGMLARNPMLQTAAGAAGGAVAEESGNPLIGAGVAAAVPVGVGAARMLPGAVRALPGVVGRGMTSINPAGAVMGGIAGSGDPVTAAAGALAGNVAQEAFATLAPWLRQQVASGAMDIRNALALQAKIGAAQGVGAMKGKN